MACFPFTPGKYGIEQEDFFHTLICICAEVDRKRSSISVFQRRAIQRIRIILDGQRCETSILYNPFQNLYLDKCYGESCVPLGSWMDFSEYTEG